MVVTFCLRLALGLLLTLLMLSPKQMHPRFFRTHFATVLGLCVVSTVMGWETPCRWPSLAAVVLAFLGSLAWIYERPPAGWSLLGLTASALALALIAGDTPPSADEALLPISGATWWSIAVANHLTAAALLGTSVTGMLVGHSYLIAPAMSIGPLMRQIVALGISLLLRVAVAGAALWFWTADHSLTNLNNEAALWLPVRWLIGLFGPAVFGWMAYQTARIRSTQSATGIMYVVVILCFLGELTHLLLARISGLPL
jgi:hypothetical protein